MRCSKIGTKRRTNVKVGLKEKKLFYKGVKEWNIYGNLYLMSLPLQWSKITAFVLFYSRQD